MTDRTLGLVDQMIQAIKAQPTLQTRAEGLAMGTLSKDSIYGFTYLENVQARPDLTASLGLPYRTRSYQSGDLFSIFSMNEPEGYLKFYIEEALARLRVPNKLLYLALTQGLQIGRVSYTHPMLELPDAPAEPLGALLHERRGSYFEHLLSKYALRSGLSGAQPKVLVPIKTEQETQPQVSGLRKALVRTESMIVKEAGKEFPGLALNEFFCMSVARTAGIETPGFWLSDDGSRLIVQRFDRNHEKRALGFEDMAVLAGVTASQKYLGSYESVMRIVRAYCRAQSAAEAMFSRIAASVLLKDGDAHLKNFGLLYTSPADEDIRPAPAYDIVCTVIYPELDREMALKMAKSRAFAAPHDLLRFAQKVGIDRDVADAWIDRINQAVDTEFTRLADDPRFATDPLGTLGKLRHALRPYESPHARPVGV